MGRRQHLEQTLLKNIEDNLPTKDGDPSVEFVLVDYNSKDGLEDWVKNNPALKPYLEDGTLVYARHPDATHFHHAHAKNMAHRLATGDVVCNLDADNYTGAGFARYLANEFAGGKAVIVHPAFSMSKNAKDEERGFFGRIALRREDFLALGGYSETRFKKGWGYEDTDLIVRALGYGLEPRPMFRADFVKVVPHSDEDRVKHTAGGVSADAVKKIHSVNTGFIKHISFAFNVCAAPVQANKGRHFGEGKICGIDGTERVIGAAKLLAKISKLGIRGLLLLKKDYEIKAPGYNA